MWLARTAEHPSCLISKCYRQGRMIHPFGIIDMRAHKQSYVQIWHIVRQIVSLFHLTISSFEYLLGFEGDVYILEGHYPRILGVHYLP